MNYVIALMYKSNLFSEERGIITQTNAWLSLLAQIIHVYGLQTLNAMLLTSQSFPLTNDALKGWQVQNQLCRLAIKARGQIPPELGTYVLVSIAHYYKLDGVDFVLLKFHCALSST